MIIEVAVRPEEVVVPNQNSTQHFRRKGKLTKRRQVLETLQVKHCLISIINLQLGIIQQLMSKKQKIS